MGALARLLVLLAAALLAAPARAEESGRDPRVDAVFADGVGAYRRGDHATAHALWKSLADEPLDGAARAALFRNLGNACHRLGRGTEAVAWYTRAVRAAPRDGDAWRSLELARREAGLEPADRGDLTSTLRRLLGSLDAAEAAWLALVSLALCAAALAVEALRGGAVWRRTALCLALGTAVASAPLAWRALSRERDPMMVVGAPSASLRSEPRQDGAPVGIALAGGVVERIDALPGWVRVRNDEGLRGWVEEREVLSLGGPR